MKDYKWGYAVIQCTWGCVQTALGLIMYCMFIRNKHCIYHGAIVTEWSYNVGASMGLFIFVPKGTLDFQKEVNLSVDLLVHEYGHTIQSILLGPLYLVVIGAPSAIWCLFPAFKKMRQRKGISYYSFYTERWADDCAKKSLMGHC